MGELDMTGKLQVVIGTLAAIASPIAAHATNVPISFYGPGGVSGMLTLTVEPNPNTGILPGTSPNPVDPIGSYLITGATGTFSDATLGLSNVAVTGVVALNKVDPETTNLLAPNSFSLLPVANGVDEGSGITSPGLHYDNLYYPGGSPQAASNYMFSGGVFDIYGLVFRIGNGDSVNFWSNGVTPGGLSYGVGVTDSINVLDYVGGVALGTPEPATWAMMVIGFGVAGAILRWQRKVRTTIRFT
jgi:hypothetical protein